MPQSCSIKTLLTSTLLATTNQTVGGSHLIYRSGTFSNNNNDDDDDDDCDDNRDEAYREVC